MGDRRVADRRAPEEGVVKIETKKLVIYLIVAIILSISIIANIILGIICFNYKNSYEDLSKMEDESIEDFANIEDDSLISDETEYTCDLSLIGDTDKIKAGESITYEVMAENIEAGNGIVMFEALLNYDTDSFDCDVVTDENIEWVKTAFVENYVTMSRSNLTPSNENQTIAKIVLTAKNDIQEGDKVLSINNIKFTSDDDITFTLPDESIDITVTND